MSKKSMSIKPIAAVVGVAFVSSMTVSSAALASENPFEAADLESGYMLAGDKDKEGKCGEGKCGEDKEEGKCGEGSCGEDGEEGSCGEGSCGEDGEEGSCGEGSCGEDDG